VWWILSGLLILIAWTLKLIFGWPFWIPIVATAVILTFVVALFIFRRIRASRAATALERAIAQQGAQQALNARPERRAEIQELQKQIQTGINALKQSKLGGGKKGGAAALYSLPWFVIVGPPGAGKTTALKHSGLVFPYGDGGVRGVGGTRNCDWWFTNEAILLDTAGRYTTEQDDHDEWIAFLQMLRKYRSRRPINGVLVAISVSELIDANEQQLEVTGKKVRARIDEVMTQLHMIVPVYVLFTKCDLIAGFNEFFGDLRKSDRAQAWGATLKLDLNKNEPGKIFDQEFDLLTKQVHARALKRLAMERNREARERVYQFPLEFAGIKRNLADLVASAFAVNAFQGTPILRGFYFTSGTQEGRPLDRVLGRMGQAMGIRPPETAVQQVIESKSYFLHDVFMNVVFPDGSIAARSASEIRRQQLMRVAISSAAFALAMIAAIPGIVSFANNRKFLRETEERVKASSVIQWADGRPPKDKLLLMAPVLDRLQEIDKFSDEGVPLEMGWLMYQGDTVYRPTMRAYVNQMQLGFVVPCKQRLEERIKLTTGKQYLKERLDLKKYLMMSDIDHLDVEWATGQFTVLWAELLRSTSNIPESDLKKMLVGHVRYYFSLLKARRVTPVPPNMALVDSARKTLMAVPPQTRYYDLFVNSITDEKYDEAGEATRVNRKYPPLTLGEMFTDRVDVLKLITSAQFQKEKRWKEIEGPYTDKGHYRVVKNIAEGLGLLEREQWVVPLSKDESRDRVAVSLHHLADDYDQRYIAAWTDWMGDLKVTSPATVKDAIELYMLLAKPDWPYLRILRAVEDHTQWKKDKSVFENEDVKRETERRVQQRAQQALGVTIPQSNFDLMKHGARLSAVPGVFKKTVEFGVPTDVRGGPAGSAPITDTPLSKYISSLSALKDAMQRAQDVDPNVDARVLNEKLADTANQANNLLKPFDDKAKQLLSPLLLDPLKILGTTIPDKPPTRTGAPPSRGVRWPRR
jgi:type VI secretion system protein ImpL